MKTAITGKGQIVLPQSLRKRDKLVAGETFEIERVAAGYYVLRRSERRFKNLAEWLEACPQKDWLVPFDRTEPADDVYRTAEALFSDRHERPQRTRPARAKPKGRGVAARKRR